MNPISRRSFAYAAALGVSGALALGRPGLSYASASLGGFEVKAYNLQKLERLNLPYVYPTAGPLQGDYTFDDKGIAVRWIDGKTFDHPVLQAQYILQRLSSYQANRDPSYLASVESHARRIQSYAVRSRGASYLPYQFDFDLHGDAALRLTAPWFSGMAQGQALSAFSRLARETGKPEYREFADALFASFHNQQSGSLPWTVKVDSRNLLWFEEYAAATGASDRTMNGHIFAVYGLYDYWQLTGSPIAKTYILGGITAVAAYIQTIRNPGWASFYCLSHRVSSASYHIVHVGQLYQLAMITSDASFSRLADDFLDDYPTSQLGGRVYIADGLHSAINIPPGSEPAEREIMVNKAEAAVCDKRAKLLGRTGVYLRMSSGTLKGYWVKEVAGKSFIRLYIEGFKFAYPRLLSFEGSKYTAYKFNENGARSQAKTATLRGSSAAHVSQRVVCNGTLYYKVADGLFAGWWIQPGVGLRLD